MVRALKRLLLFGAFALLLSACQVDVLVELDVKDNGSGTVLVEVNFDQAAVDAAGDLHGRLRVADLVEAGWEVTASEESESGGFVVAVRKGVPSAGQWQGVLDEIAGPGVFANVTIENDDEFANHTNRLTLDVDLSAGWALLTDDAATEVLRGEPFGVPIDTLTGEQAIDEIVGVTLRASVSSDDTSTPSEAVFQPTFDQEQILRVEVQSLSESSLAVLLRWIAYAAGALFVLATGLAITGLVLQRRSDRLRIERPERLASRVPGEPSSTSPSTSGLVTGEPQAGPVRLVVVEPLSVLYRQSGSADKYLLPFVRHNGGDTRADEIMEAFEALIRGRMDTAEFWEVCAVTGPPDVVDEVFTQMRWLRPGASDFLAEMQRRRIPVAAVTNDAVSWSEITRDRDRLRDVWPWLVSADIGATKPNPGMLEILRRETGVAYEHCLYIDTDLDNLDMAKSLGMKTSLFDPGDLDVPEETGHLRVGSLSGFFRRRW